MIEAKHIIKCDTEEQWLQERLNGIGASEAAIVLGISDFKSRFALWSEKVRLIESPDISDREWIYWGNKLEKDVGEGYAERSGRKVDMWPRYNIVVHPDRPWMRCTPDAMQECSERGPGLLQIKTTSNYRESDWKDGPPLDCQAQVQHELDVTGMPWGTLAALIGGQKMIFFDLDRDDEFIEKIVKSESEFWQLVQSETAPEVDDSLMTREVLKKLHPEDNGATIALEGKALSWPDELDGVKAEIKEFESKKRLLENSLISVIGDNTYGLLPNGSGYSYKTQTSMYKAREATERTFRVLRRMK